MRGLAYKKVSFISSLKRVSYPEMSPPNTSQTVSETLALLDERPQKRCCCGRFRVFGSDSVWSWVIAFANFLVNFIIVGLGRMSGIFYVEFMDLFHIDRKTASIPFSVQQAGRNLFGPAAGIFGQKYGLRSITIVGGIIGSLSAVIPYFQMDIMSIIIMWGLFFGISTALTTTLNQVSIDQYFQKYRATAGGFAFSGGCVGAFCFPVVIEMLIHDHGMRGTFLSMGAIIIIVVPAAMFLVEPPWSRSSSEKAYAKNIKQYGAFEIGDETRSSRAMLEEKRNNTINEIIDSRQLSSDINFGILQEHSDMVFQFLTMEISDGSVRSKINQNDLQKLDKGRLLNELECVYSFVADQETKQKDASVSSTSQDSKRHIQSSSKRPRERLGDDQSSDTNYEQSTRNVYDDIPRRIFIEHKLQELYGMKGTRLISHFPYPDQYRAWKILTELRKLSEKLTEKPNIPTRTNSPELKDVNDKPQIKQSSDKDSNTFCSHFKTAFKLHGNPLFLLICLCRGVFMLTFVPVVTVIVDFAMDKGLERSDGKYIIAALSLGDFLGRLGLGWVTDRGCLSLPRYMLVGMIILGGSTASLPLMNSKISLLLSVLFFAVLQGSLFVRHPMLVSQYMESHEKSIGMGFINFLSGFLGFVLPIYIGYFRDTLGSYDQMFYLNGIICAAVGFLWLFEPLFIRCSCSKTELS